MKYQQSVVRDEYELKTVKSFRVCERHDTATTLSLIQCITQKTELNMLALLSAVNPVIISTVHSAYMHNAGTDVSVCL